MSNNLQKQEALQNDFDSICNNIVKNNIIPEQHHDTNSQESVMFSNFKDYASPIINKLKPPTPWLRDSKIDQPGYITTEQLIRIIELRHKNAEQVKFYRLSKKIITIVSIIIFLTLCLCFGLHQINII